MSSRVREKQKKAEARAAASGAGERDRAPLSVAVALAFLAAFIALRGADLQFYWERSQGVAVTGVIFSMLITAVFAVGLARGDRRAWLAARPVGVALAVALVVAPYFGYPAPWQRLWSMAAALVAMVIALSLRSSRAFYAAR